MKGVLKGGDIPPLNKIYKRIDEIAPKNANLKNSSSQLSLSDSDSEDERCEDDVIEKKAASTEIEIN